MMIYLTEDTHGKFDRIGIFCNKMQTSRDDILIILGDTGINFHAGALDIRRKEYLAKLPVTLLCIHGNHERRPESLPYYAEQEWHGGKVYVEERYPNILFAKDGEVYNLDGRQATYRSTVVSDISNLTTTALNNKYTITVSSGATAAHKYKHKTNLQFAILSDSGYYIVSYGK